MKMYIMFNWHAHYMTGTGSLSNLVVQPTPHPPIFGVGLYLLVPSLETRLLFE